LDAAIIDIGGGDSFLADHLLSLGYSNISVLDISEKAILRAQSRLGPASKKINWIVADVLEFEPSELYDVWHDRAAFHFFTQPHDIDQYLEIAHKALNPGGNIILGTFSDKGPTKCSGIEIMQYSRATMTNKLTPFFSINTCFTVNHKTPFDTIQNFTFGSFKKYELDQS
jgi:2-polyprenyl-3-methyl-5-hydroxy-6-metoxy-1,4-benzoquinol methylase